MNFDSQKTQLFKLHPLQLKKHQVKSPNFQSLYDCNIRKITIINVVAYNFNFLIASLWKRTLNDNNSLSLWEKQESKVAWNHFILFQQHISFISTNKETKILNLFLLRENLLWAKNCLECTNGHWATKNKESIIPF